MATVAEVLEAGVRHHQAGELAKAETLYRQALQAEPRQVDALHLLGVLAGQVGKYDVAVQYITQAITLAPAQAIFHCSLAKAYQGLGQFDQALACCHDALRLQPEGADGHLTLGLVLLGQGQLPEAEASFREAVRLRPAFPEACNNLGNVLRRRGQLAEAEACYRAALRLRPADVIALINLGAILAEQNRLAEAEACYRQALQLRASYAEGHLHLGMLRQKQGRFAEAEACCREALRLRPAYPEAHNDLGNLRQRQGRPAEAEACYREAVRLRPAYPEAHGNLGNILLARGQAAEAEACYRAALRHRPAYADAHANLGNALRLQKRLAEAEAAYRAALHYRPSYVETHVNLGHVLRDQHNIPAARTAYEEALRLKPDFIEPRNNLGACFMEEGRWAEAVTQLREVLRLQPDYAPALGNLGTLARDGFYRFTDDETARLRTLLDSGTLTGENRCMLTYALANVLDKRKAHDEAFSYYEQANDLRREMFRQRGEGLDPEQHRRFIDSMIAVATPEFFRTVASFGNPSELPVYILGMPRSGTSLVEQILASHPQVYGGGELPHIPMLARQLSRALRVPEDYPACLARIGAEQARTLAAQQLDLLSQLGGAAVRITDKLPANVFHLALIHLLFPQARIIHCRRDPLDVCVSCFLQDFHTLSFATRLEDIGIFYREYERLAAHWRAVLPARVFEVQYEEMVANQEAVSRALVAFCGLDWHERCLTFHETRRVVQTSSVAQVRQPIYGSSVGRWRRYRRHLKPLFRALGRSETEADEPAP
jgi:tetratricopeptide (TPR) repeat protein